MRDFVHLGFNEGPGGERVFDGILNWIGGASGGFFNYRFAQPSRTHRQHIGRSPSASSRSRPGPARGDGTHRRLRRCLETDTCPKILEAPANVRVYLFSSLPHGAGFGPTGTGICQQPRNPIVANAGLRALLVALDDWVSAGREPPASRVPRRSDGTLVPALPRTVAGFPEIPGVLYTGLMSTGDRFDYGASFDRGILTTLPPTSEGSPYPAFVPKTDADGNDLAGIRLPQIAVPLATYTGWGVRAAAFAGDDLCDASGQ